MKTIVVFSDTHGNISDIERLYGILKESDYIFHLGDCQRDILLFKEFSSKIYSVCGNCDGGGDDLILQIEGLKLLLTHGDKYGVKSGIDRLFYKAKEMGVDAVFYGHTHSARIEREQDIYFINSGTLKGFEKSYCYAVIHDKKLTAKIVPILR